MEAKLMGVTSMDGKGSDIKWVDTAGEALTCQEKLKVLSENLSEFQAMAQDVFEEALILNVNETQIRQAMVCLIQDMDNPYA